jgi:hypothetical protein
VCACVSVIADTLYARVPQRQHSVRAAALVERHLSDVEQAIAIVRSAIASKLDWNALAQLVKEETRRASPIASLIHQLRLDRVRHARVRVACL